MTHSSLKDACTTNPHDRGVNIVAGTEITGETIGNVYWDAAGADAGYVLEIDGQQYTPVDVDDIAVTLASHGWRLTGESRLDVESLQWGEK